VVNVPEFVAKPMSLMFRRGSRFVEPFNQIIAERMSFISRELVDHTQLLTKKCGEHLFPETADVNARFVLLTINLMSVCAAHKQTQISITL
jgi:hypothetical protein